MPVRGALLESRYRLRNLRQAVRARPRVFALAALAVIAALALGASQFIDFSGVAVGATEYEGDVGAPAPIPESAKDTAGSAHFFVLVPAAILALVLIGLVFAGRPRLGGVVALIGLAGIVISLAVDLPQGLDKGTAGVAYQGTEARLLTGFWLQLGSSAVLAISGFLLGRQVRRERGPE
jgi:amino acid permease